MALDTILLKIIGDGSSYLRTTKEAQGATTALGKTIAKVGSAIGAAFAVTTMKRWVDEALRAADELDNFSKQMSISLDLVQRLKIAFDEAGLGVNRFRSTLEQLERNIFAAVEGNKTLLETFERLGFSHSDLQTLSKDAIVRGLANQAAGQGHRPSFRSDFTRITGAESLRFIDAFGAASDQQFGQKTTAALRRLDLAELFIARAQRAAGAAFSETIANTGVIRAMASFMGLLDPNLLTGPPQGNDRVLRRRRPLSGDTSNIKREFDLLNFSNEDELAKIGGLGFARQPKALKILEKIGGLEEKQFNELVQLNIKLAMMGRSFAGI